MNELIRLLQEDGSLTGYRIAETKTTSYELYFVHRQLETVRATDTTDTAVTVYIDHDGKTGDSTFRVYASMGPDEIRRKIRLAASRALLVHNEPYPLPEPGTLHEVLPSNMAGEDLKTLALRTADAVFAADSGEGLSLNATEVFLYREQLRVVNSRGTDKTQIKTRGMIETIPTFTEGDTSVELYEAYHFTDLDPAAITAQIRSRMEEVLLRHRAQKPQTPLTANVALRPHEIRELMHQLTGDLSYAAVYTQSSLHKKGDVLQTGSGDRLNVTRCGRLPGSAASALFDEDGVSLTDTELIRGGEVVGNFGSHRFATYLHEPETGALPCVSLAPGTLTAQELESAPYLECVSMSGLQVDLYNDYIGGEIRLAYLHEGGKIAPLTGITMSAKLSAVLNDLRLSDTQTVQGSYAGPDRMLLHGITLM